MAVILRKKRENVEKTAKKIAFFSLQARENMV
jgi:hypothetical protein